MASSVEKFVIDAEYCCGYCFQQINDVIDPRTLPCEHVFCFSCISSDYRHGSSLECPICRKKHANLTISKLPRYACDQAKPCSVCGQSAEMCCIQCSIYMCKEHAKEHDEAYASITKFGKTHEKATPINAESLAFKKKEEQFCIEHTEEKVQRACSTCYKALCMECVLSGKCSEGKSHTPEKIESLSEKLKKELISIMSDLFVKSTVLADLEKEANVILAEQEKTFVEMKSLVDKVTEEQINEIREKASKIKSAIDDTFAASTDTVRKYCERLIAKKDALDDLSQDFHSLINLQSDLSVIHHYNKSMEKPSEIFKDMQSQLSLPFIDVKQLAKQREAEVQISPVFHKIVIQPPQSVTEGSKVEEIIEPKDLVLVTTFAASRTNSVNWLSDKSLACSCCGKIDIRDEALNVIKSHPLSNTNFYTVYQYGTDYLALEFDGCHKVNVYSSDFTYKRTVIRGDFGTQSNHMAVKDNKVLVIDGKRKCVKLFTADGAHMLDVGYQPYISQPWGIQFHGDNNFLVSDYYGGKVVMFALVANSRLVWSCGGLQNPTGISIDASGLIYVTSLGIQTIYLLTPAGTLLRQFSNPELLGYRTDLSISGNNLAVCSFNGVQLFKILY